MGIRSRSRQQAHRRRTVRIDSIWLAAVLYLVIAVVMVVITWFAWALLMSLGQYIQTLP